MIMSIILGSCPHTKFKIYLIVILLCKLLAIGNCLINTNVTNNKGYSTPIGTSFRFPSRVPAWPKGGGGFATGEIDLGGLKIRKVNSFQSVGFTTKGGPGNMGATFFDPTYIPRGFSMLGAYAQPNNKPLFGWVLVAETNARDQHGEILRRPLGYKLQAHSSGSTAFFWIPIAPDGYKAIGIVVTPSADIKPSLDKIRVVRMDFTDEAEPDNWIWGESGLNVYDLRPRLSRGTNAKPLSAGTFILQAGGFTSVYLRVLMNQNRNPTGMPDKNQAVAVYRTYAPYVHFHPNETDLPSSIEWFFANGALLYKRGEESHPTPIRIDGSNLPQGGGDDDAYWLDLAPHDPQRGNLARGNIGTAELYVHVKPVLGSTFTDFQLWVFYPFNGNAVAKLGPISGIPLGGIGEHVGDWEHVTLRVSNFDGFLYSVFYAQHNGGEWVDASLLEYQNGNRVVVYSALRGHASYPRAGLVLIGGWRNFVGIRDDTGRGGKVLDGGARYMFVEGVGLQGLVAPMWLNFMREWGPKFTYNFWKEVTKVEKALPRKFRGVFRKWISSLPPEVRGQEGPLAPKGKSCWDGDEEKFH